MIEEYLEEKFGIPKNIMKRYLIIERKKKYWIASKDIEKADLTGLKIEAIGILLARKNRQIKPTTDAVQVFGKFATKNCIKLNKKQFEDVLKGMDIQTQQRAEDGYVIFFYQKMPIGIGLYRQRKVKNMIPRARRLKF